MRPTKRRWLDAYHESGHAIVAAVQGIDVHRVSILPIGRTRGRCFHGLVTDPMAALVILWAGIIAEGLSGKGRVLPRRSTGSDAPAAEKLVEKMCPNGCDAERVTLHLAAIEKASALLRRNWASVVSLAEQLQTAGELDGAVVRRTLGTFGGLALGDH